MGGELIPVPHDQATFVPNGRLVLLDRNDTGGQLVLYDVEAKKVTWINRAPPSAEFVISHNGKFAAGLAHVDDGPTGLELATLDLETGQSARLGVRVDRPARLDMNGQYREFAARSAVSDDGQLIATMVGAELRVYDARARQVAWRWTTPTPECLVSFRPGARDLVLECASPGSSGESPGNITSLAADGTGWRPAAAVSGTGATFTARGLMFFAPAGAAIAGASGSIDVVAPGFVAADGRFSPDGRYVAHRGGAHIFGLDQRRDLVSTAARGWVTFRGSIAFVLRRDGELWRHDLTSGAARKLRSFGRAVDTVKIPYFGGTSTRARYDYDLSDDGKYLYYRAADDGGKARARIFKLDQL